MTKSIGKSEKMKKEKSGINLTRLDRGWRACLVPFNFAHNIRCGLAHVSVNQLSVIVLAFK